MLPVFITLALAAPVAPDRSVYLPPNLYLVRVTTQAVWEKNPAVYQQTGRMQVTRVLAGPDRLLDREFEVSTLAPINSLTTRGEPIEIPPDILEKGAEGLWWVYEDTKDQSLRPELRWKVMERYHLIGFPYQSVRGGPLLPGGGKGYAKS